MNLPDITKLDIKSLRQLINEADARITGLQEAGRREVIERFTNEAGALGYDSLAELIGIRRRGRPSTNGGHHDVK